MPRKSPSPYPAGPENAPQALTPEKLPDPWLVNSEYLMQELARIRALALSVPLTLEA